MQTRSTIAPYRQFLTALLAVPLTLSAVQALGQSPASANETPECYRGPSETALYKITPVDSGKSLDVARKSVRSGAPIIQWVYSGGPNQQWQVLCVAPSTYRIVARHSGMVIGAEATNYDGAQLQQSVYQGSQYQQWQLARVGQSGGLATFQLFNVGSKMVIEPATDDVNLRLVPSAPEDRRQQWTFEQVGTA